MRSHGSESDACLEELRIVMGKLGGRDDLLNPKAGTVRVHDLLPILSDIAIVVASEAQEREKRKGTGGSAELEAKHELALAASEATQNLSLRARALADRAAPRYGFYAGTANQLTPDGSWKSGLDVIYRSESQEFKSFADLPSRVFVNFEYFDRDGEKTNTDPDAAMMQDSGTDAGSGDGSMQAADDPKFVSPFNAQGGIVNIQTGFSVFKPESIFGFGIRAGLESLPLDDDKSIFSSLEPFYAAGLVTRSTYSDGALGQFFLGLGRDKRWNAEYTGQEKSQYRRIILGGLLELLKFDNGASIATRIHVSTPASGKSNESEVRISVLLGFDITQLRSLAKAP